MTGVDLSLAGVADIAQIVLAGLALLALAGAVWQTSSVRRSAREALTYNYFVRFAAVETGRSLTMLLQIHGSDDENVASDSERCLLRSVWKCWAPRTYARSLEVSTSTAWSRRAW
jgi:hypothetical protein